MFVICNIHQEFQNLLPHFYKHYWEQGIRAFVFGIQGGEKNPAWDAVLHYKGANPVNGYEGEFNEENEGQWLSQIAKKSKEWYIPADLDEFHVIPGFTSFEEAKEKCLSEKAVLIESKFEDRIAPDGSIPINIDPNISIFDQFPRKAMLTERVLQGCPDKICLVKEGHIVTDGHHYTKTQYLPCSVKGTTYHFKWHGDLIEKERRKLKLRMQRGVAYALEGERLLSHIEQHDGKLF